MFDEEEIDLPPNARVNIGIDERDGVHFAIVDFVCKATGDILAHHEKECDDEDEALETAREAAGVIEDTMNVERVTVH
jgi:hypothetical protein